MDLHCAGCAHKVKKAIKRVPGMFVRSVPFRGWFISACLVLRLIFLVFHAGVESVAADVAAKQVVVAGTADAAAIKARIEAKTSKAVEVASAGGGPKKPAADAGPGEKKGDKDASHKEEEEKQPPEETKPKEVGTQEAMPPTQSAPLTRD
jgi:copper chaperone CopZ